ncbi:MAG TPA: radical SAM protein [Ktedonobacteraceae bacterium]
MQNLHVQMHTFPSYRPVSPDPALLVHLARRRQLLLEGSRDADGARPLEEWELRTYPVLAIVAPAVTGSGTNVEYPGDPMCLYAALSVAIDQVLKARAIGLCAPVSDCFTQGYTYADLCPAWGELPARAYRLQAPGSGVRVSRGSQPNTDETVFDPRIWNEDVRLYLHERVLRPLCPQVVLISCVSPAHRYALAMARQIRSTLPRALIVLGGRHIDETMRLEESSQRLQLSQSSTLCAIDDGRIEPVVDFLVGGDGYFALDWLMKAISLAMTIPQRRVEVADVVRALDRLAPHLGPVGGRAVLAAVDRGEVHVFPLRGGRIDLARLPSPYRAMAVRARFPIFHRAEGQVARTAHMMTTSACPYQCNFCSEGRGVVGQLHRLTTDPVGSALRRVLEYVSYGAEALFFDDSVFWGGNLRLIREFSAALARTRECAESEQPDQFPWLQGEEDRRRLRQLQWGAQLTAEFLVTLFPRTKILAGLVAMRAAGCSYLYLGIESLAAAVMQSVQKNLNGRGAPWADKVRQALLLAREAGIRVGSSVLFGLDGETRETIEMTIEGVGQLVDDGLLMLASPNILTYHPATAITRQHGKEDHLDYHSLNLSCRPPYSYFEEAFPGVVSNALSEDDIWYIHRRTRKRWGQVRYTDTLPAGLFAPLEQG